MRPVELDFVVALVNEYATAPRAGAGEEDEPYADLTQLAGASPAARSLVTTVDMDAAGPWLVVLADRLHRVFACAQTMPADALRVLNGLLGESLAVPHLSHSRDSTVADWQLVPSSAGQTWPSRALLAACALALYRWLGSGGSLHRLGICDAHRCADVFVDATQASSRRYCSTACANRAKVAAHRARARSRARDHEQPAAFSGR